MVGNPYLIALPSERVRPFGSKLECFHRVRKLAAEKLAVLEERLRELQSWRRELRSTLAAWDRILAKTPRGKQGRLLENFKTHPKTHARHLGRGIQKRGEL